MAKHANTAKTMFGFVRAVLGRWIPFLAPSEHLDDIYNYLGIEYVHIPVDFKNPTEDDFQSFLSSLDETKKIWVHCAANMRVSAFTYRYRTKILGQDKSQAEADLQKIWDPVGVWSEFIHR